MIEDVNISVLRYKPVKVEYSTKDIIHSLQLEISAEKEDAVWYHDNVDNARNIKRNEYLTKNRSSDSDQNPHLEDEGLYCKVTHECHDRVCQQTLLQIKKSLPKYNKYWRNEIVPMVTHYMKADGIFYIDNIAHRYNIYAW